MGLLFMFFFLSKALYYFILPYSWIIICLTIGLLIRRSSRWKRRFLFAASACSYIFSVPYFSNWALGKWELPPDALDRPYDTAVVLSGMLVANEQETELLQFNEASERLIEGVRLYKNGEVNVLLITGGAADTGYPSFNEGEHLKKLAIELGVPERDIILEAQARNTHENAFYTAQLVDEDQSLILITSAFHMRRSIACFEKQGLDVRPYPVDHKVLGSFQYQDLLPNVEAFLKWNILIKELVGMMMYRMVGYI